MNIKELGQIKLLELLAIAFETEAAHQEDNVFLSNGIGSLLIYIWHEMSDDAREYANKHSVAQYAMSVLQKNYALQKSTVESKIKNYMSDITK